VKASKRQFSTELGFGDRFYLTAKDTARRGGVQRTIPCRLVFVRRGCIQPIEPMTPNCRKAHVECYLC